MDYPRYPSGTDPEVVDHYVRTRLVVAGLVVVITIAAYLLLLGWHQQDELESGKIWTFVALLVALALWYGWSGYPVAGSVAQIVVLTLIMSVDAGTQPHDVGGDGWAPGVLFVLFETALGTFVVSLLARSCRRRFDRFSPDARGR